MFRTVYLFPVWLNLTRLITVAYVSSLLIRTLEDHIHPNSDTFFGMSTKPCLKTSAHIAKEQSTGLLQWIMLFGGFTYTIGGWSPGSDCPPIIFLIPGSHYSASCLEDILLELSPPVQMVVTVENRLC